MAITFPSAFQSAIADSAADLAAGFLTPSRYNTGCGIAGLTAGRIPYPSSATALTDSANLSFDGTTLTAAFLAGAVDTDLFSGLTNAVSSYFRVTGNILAFGSTGACSVLFEFANQQKAVFNSGSVVAFASLTSGTPTNLRAAVDTGFSRISAGVVGVGTGAQGNSAGTIQGLHNSSDGTAGITFAAQAVTSITVKDGLIVAKSP